MKQMMQIPSLFLISGSTEGSEEAINRSRQKMITASLRISFLFYLRSANGDTRQISETSMNVLKEMRRTCKIMQSFKYSTV